MILGGRKRPLWNPTVASTHWGESTFAEQAWDKSRGAGVRWAVAGALVGLLVAFIAFAPAVWLADWVATQTDQKVLLANARGTIWSGSAELILTGGRDSRDASALPGRLEWSLVPAGLGLELRARHECCLNGTVTARVRPGLGRISATLNPPPGGWVGQWPSAWLGGLGTPWNTMQLGGAVRVVTPGLSIESVQGRWRLDGSGDIELLNVSSRVTTLETLGSYRLTLAGGGENGPTRLTLSTQDGPLQLTGSGTWGPGGVRFRGEARSAAVDEAALSNLLNIIGRRDGAKSVISIG